ncbi:putative Flagellar associated PapD like [Trypanosoma vivax]|uniref:Abnormal spindle-like microcephaly-associated protein ASH domain-containing protein n=1 Tax=Trypanosoma vivax (strain Y486) TaxID=1055687 RepID=G0U4A8_TRYVY|nr:putative Flagellar associated PapD like [Trypanosoma vivax]CCC52271.1 conserved hypothetical protein [Trypanosoma vivax Y486]
MEFLTYEDGHLCDERYKDIHAAEQPLPEPRKVVHHQSRNTCYKTIHFDHVQESEAVGLFSIHPKSIDFKDFTVGEEHRIVVTLTNRTTRSCTFRVLPISPLYRDILRVQYVPPSTLSPGLQWKITAIFTPNEDVDIETAVYCRTHDGIFTIPVRAYRKQSVMSFYPEKIDFGIVTCGEKVVRHLTLRNDGALPAKVLISGTLRNRMEALHMEDNGALEEPVLRINPASYQFNVLPFSERRIEVIFSPCQNTLIDDEIDFKYESKGMTLIQRVVVKGSGGALPVYVASEQELNFNWCFYGEKYCEKITIKNTTNVMTTVVPEIPAPLASSVSFSPRTLSVQANDTSDFYLFFEPKTNLSTTVSYSILMNVQGQVGQIYVAIKARLTSHEFLITPDKLLYGACALEDEVVLPLQVENLSDLPQTLGFLKLPSNIHVLPYRCVTLSPRETIQLTVGVRPPKIGQYKQVLKLTNEYGNTKKLYVSGCGRKSVFIFSRPCIYLAACSIGNVMSATTFLTNSDNVSHYFTIGSATQSIRASPSHGVLQSRETIPIIISFSPSTQAVPSPVAEPLSRPAAKHIGKKGRERECQISIEKHVEDEVDAVEEHYKAWESNAPGELWCKNMTYFLKCFADSDITEHVALVQVNCVVVKPTLFVRSVLRVCQKPVPQKVFKRGLMKGEAHSSVDQPPLLDVSSCTTHLEMNFGEVSPKYRTDRACLLKYVGDKPVRLYIRPLDPLSPFTVTKPGPLVLCPNEECAFGVRFNPVEFGVFREKIVITSSDSNDIVLSLVGICQTAELYVGVDGEHNGDSKSVERVAMDAVLIGQEARTQLVFHNLNSSPVEVNVTFIDAEGRKPMWPESHSFIFESCHFTVPAKAKTLKSIIFSPRVGGFLSLYLQITSGAFKHSILVEGRGCESPIFFTFPGQRQMVEVDRMQVTGVQPSVFPITGISILDPVRLHCVSEDTKTIYVGSVKPGAGFDCTVNGWNEMYNESGWKLEPFKLSGSPGGQGTFTLTYNPKRESNDVSFCTFSFTVKCPLIQGELVYHVQCTGTM